MDRRIYDTGFDPTAAACALEALACDETLRARMGIAALQRVLLHFSLDQQFSVFKKLTSSNENQSP